MNAKRFSYFKAGDAATELTLVGPSPGTVPEGGPLLYVTSFLHCIGDSPALLHSLDNSTKSERKGNVEAHTHPYLAQKGAVAPLRKSAMMLSILTSLVRFKPDVIICPLMGSPLWISKLASMLVGGKLIHSRHSLVPEAKNPWKRFSRWLDRRIMRNAAAVLCHGRFLAEQLRGEGVPENKILPFEPGFREFRNSASGREQTLVQKGCSYVLYAGRMLANKGAVDLFHATLPLLEEHEQLRLVYAGDGPALAEVAKLSRKHDVAGQVLLPGMIPHEDLGPLVRDALFVVTPTQQRCPEGRCKTAAESLVLGRPVVAPAFGPFPHYLNHDQDSLLYPPDDLSALTQSMRSLLEDKGKLARLSQGAEQAGNRILDPQASFLEALAKGLGLADSLPYKDTQKDNIHNTRQER